MHYLYITDKSIRYSKQQPTADDVSDINQGLLRVVDITNPNQPMEYEPTSSGCIWNGLNRVGDPNIDAMLVVAKKRGSAPEPGDD